MLQNLMISVRILNYDLKFNDIQLRLFKIFVKI